MTRESVIVGALDVIVSAMLIILMYLYQTVCSIDPKQQETLSTYDKSIVVRLATTLAFWRT